MGSSDGPLHEIPGGAAQLKPPVDTSSATSTLSSRLQAFYLGPRGTYSHGVARAVFHSVSDPAAPPTPGAGDFAPSPPREPDHVELIPCATITAVLDAALKAAQCAPSSNSALLAAATRSDRSATGQDEDTSPRTSAQGSAGTYAVLPIENSTFGPVHETLKALEHAGISIEPQGDFHIAEPAAPAADVDGRRSQPRIVGEFRLPVSHTLLASSATKERLRSLAQARRRKGSIDIDHVVQSGLAKAGCANGNGHASGNGNGHANTVSIDSAPRNDELELDELSEVDEVLSHEQALGQCSKFFNRYAPRARRTAVSSTALAAELAMAASANDRLIVAVGAELCSEVYGLAVLRRQVEDEQDNTTRFIVVRVDSLTLAQLPKPRLEMLQPFAGVPLYSASPSATAAS